MCHTYYRSCTSNNLGLPRELVMCQKGCLVVHGLCGILYTSAGSILMVAGLFFFISSPLLQLGSNILTGGLCIVFGVGSVILTCFGARDLPKSRIDLILGCNLFVLVASLANIIILEVGEWWLLYDRSNLKEVIEMHQMEELAYYGHLVPSVTSLAVFAVAFLDAQFLYCTYHAKKNPRLRNVHHVNEAVSDIEYIIPRHKTRPMGTKPAQSLSHYTQSWVFDTEVSSQSESPYLMLPPPSSSDPPKRHPSPLITVQAECEESGDVETQRQLRHMKSFSRSHSPPSSPIYERLTRAQLYRDPRQRHHATLMAELGRSIFTEPRQSQSHSDTDFSQELEAALKLIQDLESPNTIETPSETCRAEVRGDSGSSGRSSCNGKLTAVGPVESLSTSGYNSPTLSDRTTSPDVSAMACVIRHVGPTARISIFPAGAPCAAPVLGSSPILSPVMTAPSELAARGSHARTLSAGDAMKFVLGKMRRGLMKSRRPSLAPDLERAVLKSESLAFLTERELEERLRRTWDVHRRVEAKVKQDFSLRKCESFSSIEDIMENKQLTQL